ncbi:hypothetical protein GCM10008935_17930 [Alkalibacillus silvisoli]|uniref:Type II toxin-antitoxin system HicA family toxin n=1 Tax=Alkalibacillus silvisoli TaxID=392823 RepID=A0ABP3JU09_9BACI
MPTWREIDRFCQRDGWEQIKRKSHHIYYRKQKSDGNFKRVKVSRGTGEIKGHLWKEILKKQLEVDEEYFNRVK